MSRKKILIVDDSEIVLKLAREALEDAGFETVTAIDGIEAKRHIFTAGKPDLIILDVMMPVLEGHKLAKQLRNKEASRDIPILLLSSKPENELRRLAGESGANGFIRKPFTDQSIVAIVKEYLPAIS
jgi:two-component system, OmpR family, alkaline phosphatase synthesis response regulator PhoP